MPPDTKQYFALTEEEAQSKYIKYKAEDPFSDIAPALLNSAHIQAYIAKTGMIYPYFPDSDPKKEKITSASMIMTIGPEVLYWDEDDKEQYFSDLKNEASITLRPNSITFLRPYERFNIPDYIAARFNLRIKHVHRGLLLGTGPLLDPGFSGYPMIPVHNLTENEYRVRFGEDFINVEFTKISGDFRGKEDIDDNLARKFEYMPNRMKVCDFNFTKYIDNNVPQKKVKSSLSSVLDKAKALVKKQKYFVYGSIVASMIALGSLIYGGYQLTISAVSIIDNARGSINQQKDLYEKFIIFQDNFDKLEKEVQQLKSMKNLDDSLNNKGTDAPENKTISKGDKNGSH
jgi:deoxycytidine triphosphate deaminase